MAKSLYFIDLKKIQEEFKKKLKGALADYYNPHSHITHEATQVYIEIRVPEVKQNSTKINLNDDFLEVKGEMSKRGKDELMWGGFYRKIDLPKGLDIKKVKYNFTKDALKIKIPRMKIK